MTAERYHFNNVGMVREIVYPNKAILSFKLNSREEKAILLSKVSAIAELGDVGHSSEALSLLWHT